MKIIRNAFYEHIRLIDDKSDDYISIYPFNGDLYFVFTTNKQFVIDNEIDKDFYFALSWFMSNEYIIMQDSSFKHLNLLEYTSDSAINDLNHAKLYAKLIIKKIDDKILLGCSPRKKISKLRRLQISLNFNNNGFFTANIKTGTSLQEDMLYAFYMALYKEQFENKFNEHYFSSENMIKRKIIDKASKCV